MKKQYDACYYDDELKRLNTNLVWKQADNPDLKTNLIRDMKRNQHRVKFNKYFGYVLRFGAVAVVLFILFIIGKGEITLDRSLGSELETYMDKQIANPFEIVAKYESSSALTFSASEQNFIEAKVGKDTIELTEQSTISLNLSEQVKSISGKPSIEVRKNNGLLIINAVYPLTNGQKSIKVSATTNTFGSTEAASEVFESLYSNSEKTSISNKEAILYDSGNDRNSELLIIDDKYLYLIEGEDREALIKVAKQINFFN